MTKIGESSPPTVALAGEVFTSRGVELKRVRVPIVGTLPDGRQVVLNTPAELISATRRVEGGDTARARQLTPNELRQLNAPFKLAGDAPFPESLELVVPADLEILPPHEWPAGTVVPRDTFVTDERGNVSADVSKLPAWLRPGPDQTRLVQAKIDHGSSTTTVWAGPQSHRAITTGAWQRDRLTRALCFSPSRPDPNHRVDWGPSAEDLPALRAACGIEPDGSIPEGGPDGSGHHAAWLRQLLQRTERYSPADLRALAGNESERVRSQVGADAALLFRVTGDARYRELALTALQTMSEPFVIEESNTLAELTARMNSTDPNWGPYVSAARYMQKHAFTYSLLRGSLTDTEAKSARRRLVAQARDWYKSTPFRYANNHIARHGSALGSVALALWDEPGLQGEVQSWLGMANYGVSLGLNHIAEDGPNDEGAVYSNYGDQTILVFLRQSLEASGRSAALNDPRVRGYVQYMARFYWPGVGWQSWDDGNPGQGAYLPLLLSPKVADAPLIKRTMGDTLPVPWDVYAEAILFCDPYDEVVPATAAETEQENFFYERGGVALFQAPEPGAGRLPWRLALVSETRTAQGHEKANQLTFVGAVADASITNSVTYVPGGTKDHEYHEGAIPAASNAPQNEFGGPFGEAGKGLTGSFDAHGLAVSGGRTRTESMEQSRQLAWVRDGQYAVLVDWSESPEPRESSFQFHGHGRSVPGGFELDNGHTIRFLPVADHAPELVDPLGRHSDYHGHEDHHDILKRAQVGKETSFLTLVSPNQGLSTRDLRAGGRVVGAAVTADDGSGEDILLKSKPGEAVTHERITLDGVAALVTGTANDPPHSISLFHGTHLAIGELSVRASEPIDAFFKLSPDTDGHGWQGQVNGPDRPWQLTLDCGFAPRTVLFNGEPMKPVLHEGRWRLDLEGSGTLCLGSGPRLNVLLDGPQSLAEAVDTRSVRERSTLEYLGGFRDQVELERALAELTPEEQQRLIYEIMSETFPAAYDAVFERIAGAFGLTSADLNTLLGTLMLWSSGGGTFPIAVGVENVTDDGDRVIGTEGSGNLLASRKITMVRAYARWEGEGHVSARYRSGTESKGGVWGESGLDPGASVQVDGGVVVGDTEIEGAVLHAATEDFSETSASVSVSGDGASGGVRGRVRDGELVSGAGAVSVGDASLRAEVDGNNFAVRTGFQKSHLGVSKTGDQRSVDAGTAFDPGPLGNLAMLSGGVTEDGNGQQVFRGQASLAGNQCYVTGGFVHAPGSFAAHLRGGARTGAGQVSGSAALEDNRVIWSGSLATGGQRVEIAFDELALRRIGMSMRQRWSGGQMRLGGSAEWDEAGRPLVGAIGQVELASSGTQSLHGGFNVATRDFSQIERFKLDLIVHL